MSDFIREVDEDLRQDKVKQALNRYWYVIATVVVLILGGVSAWKIVDYLRTQKAEASSGQYLNALDLARDGKGDEAAAALKTVVADGTPGYALLARFRLAGEMGAKDPVAAAAMFDALATDPAVEPAMQPVAKLRAALLRLDKLPYDEFKARTEPLADANSPVRNSARELLALAALKAGQPQDAGRYLHAIEEDATASGALRQRTQVLLGLVQASGKAADPAGASPAPAPAPAPMTPAPATPAPTAPAPSAPAAPADAAPPASAAPGDTPPK